MNGLLARAAASAALLVPLLLAPAAPVLASCIMPPPIEEAVRDADVVFVGTVIRVANLDRWATVAVEEVWKGPDMAPLVEVRGGPGGNAASSVDRSFTAGTRYLFLPFIAEGALQDSSCSSTTEFAADLIRLRPATAHPPIAPAPDPDTADPFDPASLLVPAALIVGAGVLVFGGALALRRRS
jgi:hypothetical protein